MADELDRAIATLKDREMTWVARRDAADWLGKLAARALDGLTASRAQDGDRDVQDAVNRALAEAKDSLGTVEPNTGRLSIDTLVKAIAKPGVRDVAPKDDGFEITVALRDGRAQRISVVKDKAQSGDETVRLSTRCGPAADKALRWALKTNCGFTHCGMALVEDAGKEWFDLLHAIPIETATVDEFKACLKEMAFYGDWAETKLSEGDAF